MEPNPAAALFVTAVTELASHGAIQQRLNRAWTASLSNVQLTDLPSDLKPRVEELNQKLGGTMITRAMLTDDEAARIAQEIVAVAFELGRPADPGGD